MIPAAKETLQNFKKAYYGMKLSEVVPLVPVIPLNSSHTVIAEHLSVDPKEYTIEELHKHRFYLETELLKSGSGSLTCYKITVGSLFILWQIHSYEAYLTVSMVKSVAIHHISVPVIEKWTKLPVVLRGQTVENIGPIEQPLKDYNREDPYPGFKWTWLNGHDVAEKYKHEENHKWYITHPRFDPSYIVGISSQDVILVTNSVPNFISVRGCVFSVACAEFRPPQCDLPVADERITLLVAEILKCYYLVIFL